MTRHVLAPVGAIPPGGRKRFVVKGRPIAVFNLDDEFFGLLDRCPHQGGSLCAGVVTGLLHSAAPGSYAYTRKGEIIRCPWHGWEFDIRTGRSTCEPDRIGTRAFSIATEPGSGLAEAPLAAETVPVRVEEDYIVVDV